jgi:hypothetical protein
MQATPKAQLIEVLLGEPLGDWVRRHRDDDRSWQWIANQVLTQTNSQVTVTGEYLRRLFGEDPPVSKSA